MRRRSLRLALVALTLVAVAVPHFLTPQPVLAAIVEFDCTMDTYIYEDEPTTTHDGDSVRVGIWGPAGHTVRSILQFPIDWGVDIPADATIVEATFTLHAVSSAGYDMTLLAQRLRRLNCDETEATWQVYQSGYSWGTAGAASSSSDYSTTYQASGFYDTSEHLEPVDFDVTDLVDRAQAYEEDVAFRVVAQSETAYRHVSFGDHDDVSPPQLTVQYSYPAPGSSAPTVSTGTYSNLGATTVTLHGDVTDVDNGLAIYEDFEWGNDEDDLNVSGGRVIWSTLTPGSSKAEIDTAYDYEGTRSGRLYRDGSNHPRASFAHSAMGSTETFSIRVRKDDTSRVSFYHGNGVKVINCGIYIDERITYFDGTTNHYPGDTVTVGSWNLIEIMDVNWAAGTYDIYLNGWWCCTADMRTSSSWANSMYLYNVAGTSAWWADNVGFRPYVSDRGFQYGLTQTPTWSESEGGLFGEGAYSLPIDELTSNTEYWYRAYVSNEEGTAYGSWSSFSTIGPPTITTEEASNVAGTTARLNSALEDDGNDPCTIKFGWGLTSESAIDDYDSTETLAGTYTTGSYPYLDVEGLLAGYTYYFRVQATNEGGSDLGSELSFETPVTLDAPTNFVGYPEATTISLSWSKGTGASTTLIRYGATTYPAGTAEGTFAYSGPGSTYTVTDLVSGKNYYFSAWGESGGNYSASYTTLLMTTSPTGADVGPDVDVPTEPSRWLAAPDYTSLDGLGPIYDGVNAVIDTANMPRETGWFLLWLLLSVVFGLFAYLKLGKKMMIGMMVLTICLALGYFARIIPGWLPVMTLILVIALASTHKQVAKG